MTTFRKVVEFDAAEMDDVRWLVSDGFGKNATDAIRKSVAFTRAAREASV